MKTRNVLLGSCAWLLAVTLATGGLPQSLPWVGPGGTFTPPSIAFGSSGTSNNGTYTFGTAASGRIVVAGFSWTVNQILVTTSSVSIGGVSATLAVRTKIDVGTPSSIGSDIWAAVVPTGTSGVVSITWSGPTLQSVYIGTYSIYSVGNLTPAASGTGATLSVNNNGVVVANVYSGNAGSSPALAFTSPLSNAWTDTSICAALRGGGIAGPIAAQSASIAYTRGSCGAESIKLLVSATWN